MKIIEMYKNVFVPYPERYEPYLKNDLLEYITKLEMFFLIVPPILGFFSAIILKNIWLFLLIIPNGLLAGAVFVKYGNKIFLKHFTIRRNK